ncbi:MAG: hypothetical protein IJ666_08505 [Ruminococcus sp.]|nr:hypothetical protein [Ruminococcus sp.]
MLKGVNRTIIEVNHTDSIYFEKAVFYLRPEVRSLPAEFIRSEADKYISYAEPCRRRRFISRKAYTALIILTLVAALCFAGAYFI